MTLDHQVIILLVREKVIHRAGAIMSFPFIKVAPVETVAMERGVPRATQGNLASAGSRAGKANPDRGVHRVRPGRR